MICQGCGCVFCPEPPDQPGGFAPSAYCTPSCRQETKRRRARARGDRPSQKQKARRARYRRAVCDEKNKIPYPTREAAWAAIPELNARLHRNLCDVYSCGDHWHTTSHGREPLRIARRGSREATAYVGKPAELLDLIHAPDTAL